MYPAGPLASSHASHDYLDLGDGVDQGPSDKQQYEEDSRQPVVYSPSKQQSAVYNPSQQQPVVYSPGQQQPVVYSLGQQQPVACPV